MKFIKYSFLFVVCVSGLLVASPEPYASLKLLSFDGHGWFCDSNADALRDAITVLKPKIVIEIGSWLGSSTRFMAERLPKGARLYAIDHWLGSVEHYYMPDAKERLPFLYQQFLSNIAYAGLTEVVVPVRMSSEEAFYALDLQADLIYLDAAHDAESVYHDIMMWSKKLSSRGQLYGDDYSWESVRIGLYRAANELGARVESFGNQAWRLVFNERLSRTRRVTISPKVF